MTRVQYLHGIDQHAREAEGHSLGELVPLHGDLEAIRKVDVHDTARDTVHHDVAIRISGGVHA